MAVKLHLGLAVLIRDAEMVKQACPRPFAIAFVSCTQVFDDGLGVHLFLQVNGGRIGGDGGLIDILASPDDLRIKVGVAQVVCGLDGLCILGIHHRRQFRRGDVHPVVRVRDGIDGGAFVGHVMLAFSTGANALR
ncbi:hypothetical protein [Roseobacter sp. AzwK-3b]|uniref:hypothetical protein n=1 Tax=Roseobacter sp. AzwK-3b TaxID=351016 RepID=UPI001E3BF6F0|nr:hypothetical protein [Roseobacter sp. AzwK-3b]